MTQTEKKRFVSLPRLKPGYLGKTMNPLASQLCHVATLLICQVPINFQKLYFLAMGHIL
jgi:hypothetical protein